MSDYQTQIANTADQRTLGYFQLSVSTSLAIESAVGIHPDLPTPRSMPILDYKEVWINLRTLYRNMVNAMSKDIGAAIGAPDIVQIMAEEMRLIPDVLSHYAGYPVVVKYYFNNLKHLEKKYPHAQLRKDTTPRMQQFTSRLGEVITIMEHYHKNEFMVVDDMLPGNTVDTLIITHVVYDLLSANRFHNLTLLESHTGRIKPKALWYTKYYDGKTLSMIPFNEELLQVFGDLDTFHPLDVKMRKAIIELATRRNWHAATTRARIVEGIGELANPAYVLKLKQIFGVLF